MDSGFQTSPREISVLIYFSLGRFICVSCCLFEFWINCQCLRKVVDVRRGGGEMIGTNLSMRYNGPTATTYLFNAVPPSYLEPLLLFTVGIKTVFSSANQKN